MTKNLRRINPTEHQIQAAIVERCQFIVLDPTKHINNRIGDFLIKIPNEGKRSFKLGKYMKAEGLKRGAADIFLAIPKRDKFGYIVSCGLWIEVKQKNGRLSVYQTLFMEDMLRQGYSHLIVKNADEGIEAIKDYLGMR